MKVWRIHIKNDIEQSKTRQDLLSFCKREKIIGVGWNEIRTKVNSEDSIRKEAAVYPDGPLSRFSTN